MYANYFGFRDIPFRQLSDHQHVFLSPGFLAAETELQEAVQNHARLILLTGHAGTGKTKLLSHLQVRLDETRPVFYLPYSALLSNPSSVLLRLHWTYIYRTAPTFSARCRKV